MNIIRMLKFKLPEIKVVVFKMCKNYLFEIKVDFKIDPDPPFITTWILIHILFDNCTVDFLYPPQFFLAMRYMKQKKL